MGHVFGILPVKYTSCHLGEIRRCDIIFINEEILQKLMLCGEDLTAHIPYLPVLMKHIDRDVEVYTIINLIIRLCDNENLTTQVSHCTIGVACK